MIDRSLDRSLDMSIDKLQDLPFEDWTFQKLDLLKLDLLENGPFGNWIFWKYNLLEIGPFVATYIFNYNGMFRVIQTNSM